MVGDSAIINDKILIYRPRVGKQLVFRGIFLRRYDSINEKEARALWVNEYEMKLSYGRVTTYHVLTGAVIPLWLVLVKTVAHFGRHSSKFRLVRAKIEDAVSDTSEERKLIGIWIPTKIIGEVLFYIHVLKILTFDLKSIYKYFRF
jgi:hypothetical protein